jgi:lysophospholipase II
MLLQNRLYLAVLATILMQRTVSAMTSSSSQRGALIFLHGLGDSPAGWSDLERSLPELQPRLASLEYVFPAAPTIPIAINGGARMPGWFDLYDWPIEVGAQDDPVGLAAGVKTVEQHVKELNDKGIANDKIVVGGFSQGGAVALLAAYQSKTRYAGCVGLSAWLTLPEQLNVSDEARKTPLYWGHGTFDDKVVFAQQSFGVGKLREQGVNVKDEVRSRLLFVVRGRRCSVSLTYRSHLAHPASLLTLDIRHILRKWPHLLSSWTITSLEPEQLEGRNCRCNFPGQLRCKTIVVHC